MLKRPVLIGSAFLSATLLLLGAGSAAAETASPSAATPKVTLTLVRTGYDYRWEYRVRVRIRPAGPAKVRSTRRVVATALMSAPGHVMSAGPVRLSTRGAGLYEAKVAFYMPGDWKIAIAVSGGTAAAATTRFDVVLK